jgi:HPr kinase/phosphorylase
MKKELNVEDFVKVLKLTPVHKSAKEKIEVNTSDLNRPGLQMSGFFEYFAINRIQLFGMVEMTYLEHLEPDVRKERMEEYFSSNIPMVLIGRNLNPPDDMIEATKKYDVPMYMSGLTTTKLGHKTTEYLDMFLAPSISRHAGLMDVYGIGIMITGDSGVGKSETALELVKRGHRLVADDVVDIKKLSETELLGQSPEIIRHMMEIRGMGIIDVRELYGVGAVMLEKSIDLAIHLEPGDFKDIDRLGMTQRYTNLLNVKIPEIVIPVRPGRNLAIIIEVAAMNFRLRSMGQDTAGQLDEKLVEIMNAYE